MNSRTKYLKITVCVLVLISNTNLFAQHTKVDAKEFPTPTGNPKQLFYLQRNENINTIVYEINEQNGNLDSKNPIHVFWILYTKQAQREELAAMERKFAYGIKIKSSDKDQCFFTLVAYPKISLHLAKDSAQKFQVYVTPTKHQMILHKTFIKVKEGGFKLNPVVEYIEFSGIVVVTGKEVIERIVP